MAIVATNLLGNVFDFDNYTDFASDAADAVADVATSIADNIYDARKIIGGALRTIAPIVALYPGIGTGIAVALEAGAHAALGSPIQDAIVETASAAIPGGLPRAAFDGAADMTRKVLDGQPVFEAAIDTMRNAANQAGGERAVYAFDTGLAIARGDRVDQRALDLARANIANGGTTALAAFDAGVSLANGERWDEAAQAAARVYVEQAGGPGALVAFDVGTGIARGKALQDAGFAALKNFVKGNEAQERALNFAEAMISAAANGEDLLDVLEDELARDVQLAARLGAGPLIGPVLERIQLDPSLLEMGSGALAYAMGVGEPIARAAQAILRDGEPDQELAQRLMGNPWVKQTVKAAPSAVQRAQVAAPGVTSGTSLVTSRSTYALATPGVKQTTTVQATPAQSATVVSRPPAPPLVAAGPAPIVAAPAPSSRRSTLGADIALGGVVALALGSLYLWATADGR